MGFFFFLYLWFKAIVHGDLDFKQSLLTGKGLMGKCKEISKKIDIDDSD